ncbi:MAG: asparagine synthase (glutamine-hydrolyzing), partial [Saprospiraceae bacterium]
TMTQRMQHRGPDGDGHYTDDLVALGHRRLAILDLSELGAQPMWDASGRYAITYNGEIYNFRELRAELAGYPFRSHSDTEVILAGFAAWGIQLFERLNGIFAFALYDKQARTLYAVRDRFGIKPLYYSDLDSHFLVASEQRALLATGLVSKKVSTLALSDFLSNGSVAGAQGMAEGLRQLPGGYYLEIRPGQHSQPIPYHLFYQTHRDPVEASREQVTKNIRDLLLKSVESQLVSDVPLGAFLSGGIDSSAIVALMSEVSATKPMTFTIGFEEKKYDESAYAEIVAKKYGTQHTVLTLSPGNFLDALPEALEAMDTPTMDGPNSYVVSKLTRAAGVTVALSGLGGDELFAGYAPFLRYHNWRGNLWWKVPHAIRRGLTAPLAAWGTSTKYRRIGCLLQVPAFEIEHVYPNFRSVMDEQTVRQLLNGEYSGISPTLLQANKGDIHRFPPLSQYTIAEMTGYTQHMLLKDTDQMSMASSLEVRVPFFDNDLVEYVLRIPDALKYPQSPKQLLVEAMQDRLPPSIVNRPKMGFTLPWANWLRTELADFCETHIQALCDRRILDSDAIRTLWTDFKQHKHQVLWSHVWMFVVLEYWLQKNLD